MNNEELQEYCKKASGQICKQDYEIRKLQKENKQLKIQISAREEEYRELEDKYKELDKMCELYSKSLYNAELNQYKDNWNKLKKFIVKEYYMYLPLEASTKSITILINKMQELEQGEE